MKNTQVHNNKLRIITRRDLTAGYQAVQSLHAIPEFQKEHTNIYNSWYNNSNYIAFLSVSNEEDLCSLAKKAIEAGIAVSKFFEPDLGGQLTSIALEPCDASSRITSSLPRALKEYENNNLS